jgi:hypothetical protein
MDLDFNKLRVAYTAFLEVMQKRQAKYIEVVSWLQDETAKLGPANRLATC